MQTQKQIKLEKLANRLLRSANHKSKRINKLIIKANGLSKEENKFFYESKEWRYLRYQVLRKYGKRCMCCGAKSGEFHVDHIEPISIKPHLRLEFNNLQVLCKDCNFGKGNIYSDDFRPMLIKAPETGECYSDEF